MERRRVVITGMGAVTPLGLTCPDSWQAVREGVCGIAPITQFDASELKVKLAAEVKGFAPEELLGKADAKRMGRFTQFAAVAAQEALADAGFDVSSADPDRCGVSVSSGIGGCPSPRRSTAAGWSGGGTACPPSTFPPASGNMPPAR